jgi:hypothetical protein
MATDLEKDISYSSNFKENPRPCKITLIRINSAFM